MKYISIAKNNNNNTEVMFLLQCTIFFSVLNKSFQKENMLKISAFFEKL